jgi:hypothetical protein
MEMGMIVLLLLEGEADPVLLMEKEAGDWVRDWVREELALVLNPVR